MARGIVGAWQALVACLGLVGCSYTSPYMREVAAPQALRPPADQALVVFVRPSAMAFGVGVTILDGKGRFLGDLPSEAHFAVPVPAGEHVFLAWAENTAALRASLAPGRVYFVHVSPRMGAFSARMQLLALTPRSPDWPHRDEWLRQTRLFQPDEQAGQAHMDGRAADRAERLRRAQEILGEYKPEELAERTIVAEDGM